MSPSDLKHHVQLNAGVTLSGIQWVDSTVAVVVLSNPHLVSQMEGNFLPAEGNVPSVPQIHLAAKIKHQHLETSEWCVKTWSHPINQQELAVNERLRPRPQRSPVGRCWVSRPRPVHEEPICPPLSYTHSWTPPLLAQTAHPLLEPQLLWEETSKYLHNGGKTYICVAF